MFEQSCIAKTTPELQYHEIFPIDRSQLLFFFYNHIAYPYFQHLFIQQKTTYGNNGLVGGELAINSMLWVSSENLKTTPMVKHFFLFIYELIFDWD